MSVPIPRWLLYCLASLIAGCAPTPPVPPGPAQQSADLVRRHYDQSCRIDLRDQPALTAAELLDLAGLPDALRELAPGPRESSPSSGRTQWHTLDFITHYDQNGDVAATGAWESSLEPELSAQVTDVLRRRVRPLPRLLEAEGFRTVVVLSPRPTVEVGQAVACLPHVKHEPDQRPPGLPLEVSTWYEFRSRPSSAASGGATLRLHFDREGTITAIDSIAGDAVAVDAARAVVMGLQYDPALRNGVPVLSEVVQSFSFRSGYLPRR